MSRILLLCWALSLSGALATAAEMPHADPGLRPISECLAGLDCEVDPVDRGEVAELLAQPNGSDQGGIGVLTPG